MMSGFAPTAPATGQGGVYGMLHPETSSAWTTIELPSDSMWGGGGDIEVPPDIGLELKQQGSQWQLVMDSSKWHQEGDAWSIEVVDDHGSVIVNGHGTVHFQYPPGVCDSCGYATATIN